MASYPRPTSMRSFQSVRPRSLFPITPPPAYLLLYPPTLPSPPRQPVIPALATGYTLTTHLIPAAYPRTTPFIPLPPSGPPGERKDVRGARAARLADELMGHKARQAAGALDAARGREDGRLLWTTANRYVRRSTMEDRRQARVTLLLAHANGFPKEIWEPFLAHLAARVCVDEVWAFEAVQHGDAALVNAGKLGALYDWSDNTRDMLNFLLHYLPPAGDAPSPVHLPRVPDDVAQARRTSGFADRSLVVVGHSFGGCTATLAALNVPSLFSALVLVDPVITAPFHNRSENLTKMVIDAVKRRNEWPSREEARRLFQASPFFSAWDPAVLDVYLECGLAPSERGAQDASVRLKMPGVQEAVVFCEHIVPREVYELLPKLDKRIALRWIMAGKNALTTGGEETTQQLVWRRPENSFNTRISSSGHLIAQEAPEELARDICEFLERTYSHDKARL